MTRSNKIALVVIAGGLTTMILLWASASFILQRSGLCTLTLLLDNKFGDQHLKTTVAHYPNEARDRYYLEVTRGWLCEPKLSYPAEFWAGTGYDASLRP